MNKDWVKYVSIGILLIILFKEFEPIMRFVFIALLSMLFAIFLFMSGRRISEKVGLPEKVWTVILMIVIFSSVIGLIIYSGDAFAEQFDQLVPKVSTSIEAATSALEQYNWGRAILDAVGQANISASLPTLHDVVSRLITGIIILAVILIAGIFISLEPNWYREGLLGAVKKKEQKRLSETLYELRDRLYRWTIGRLSSMFVVFILTLIGLLMIRAPLSVILAVIAGLLSFVPNFGPIASTVLAALVGFSVTWQMALWIVLVFVIVQLLESNLITPMIERRAADLPAGLILLVQTLMGLSFGILGVIVATPLTVASIVVFRKYRS